MKLGGNWTIFFMYIASPFFNSFLPANPFDLPINKNAVYRLLQHPFHLLLWQSSDIRWQYRISLCFRAVLEALLMLPSGHALLHPASAWEENMRCPALLCSPVSFQRNSWKISQYYNTPASLPVRTMGRFRAASLSVLLLRRFQDVHFGAPAACRTGTYPGIQPYNLENPSQSSQCCQVKHNK